MRHYSHKNQTNKMKKVLLLLTGFAFAGLVACGPSADDLKKLEETMNAAGDSALKSLEDKAAAAATDSVPAATEDSAHAH